MVLSSPSFPTTGTFFGNENGDAVKGLLFAYSAVLLEFAMSCLLQMLSYSMPMNGSICAVFHVKRKPDGIIALLDEAWYGEYSSKSIQKSTKGYQVQRFNLCSLETYIAETSLTVDGVGLFS
ncbi:hypothetical protein Tco_1501968 [Tanacetum coccineum]